MSEYLEEILIKKFKQEIWTNDSSISECLDETCLKKFKQENWTRNLNKKLSLKI